MNDRSKQRLTNFVTYSLFAFFLYLIVLTVGIPVFRLIICKQEDTFDLNLLTIVGAIVGFLSMVLAIFFQYVSSEGNKRVEAAVNSINETVISVKTLVEDINHKQDVINATQTFPISGMSSQMPNKDWAPDPSK